MLYVLTGASGKGKSTFAKHLGIKVYDEPCSEIPLEMSYTTFNLIYKESKTRDVLIVTHKLGIIALAKSLENVRFLTLD